MPLHLHVKKEMPKVKINRTENVKPQTAREAGHYFNSALLEQIQARGDAIRKAYDEKADVWSFGVIVWELLSRECPYEGMTAIQCALAVLNRDKRPDIPKWCPPGLHALIKACLKKEPSERPSFTIERGTP